MGPMTVPPNANTVIIWCWFALPDGKEIIRITSEQEAEVIKNEN